MESKLLLIGHRPWTAAQKIAFRFFFLFLSLQVLTENFLGNLFGGSLFMWRLGEKIFVPSCLWLNRHIFHFKYIPQSWTTFSGSLHTVRDTVYLTLACFGCLLWTIIDRKRAGYDKLHYWFTQCLVAALACITFSYGVIKLFPLQMSAPSFIRLNGTVGDLRPFDLLWVTFGYGKPYQVFTGFFEMTGAILILFRKTRVAGLLIIASVMLNVIMLNYVYQVGVLILSFYIFLVTLFLLAPYTRTLFRFLFAGETTKLFSNEYIPAKNLKTRLFKITLLLLTLACFFFNSRFTYNLYTTTEAINHTRRYSFVKNYIVNNDTLKPAENDTLCWRLWSERIANGKTWVTITTMDPSAVKTYGIEQDSSKHTLTLHSLNPRDTSSLSFGYSDIDKVRWRLEGTIQQQKVQVDLQRINPDTTMKLLKVKRNIIVFDDDSDDE